MHATGNDTNLSSMRDEDNGTDWFIRDFAGYPIVYPITVYYLYPIIVFGRVTHVIWYVIGVIGNLLSMKIWMNPRMKRANSSALYLISLTVCDIMYQILHVFNYLKYFWGLASLGLPVLCQVWNILNVIPQYASQLLVLSFTMERVISIFNPFKSERFSKVKRAPKFIATIIVFVVMTSVIQGYIWAVDDSGFCEMRHERGVGRFYFIWSLVTESLFFFIVPVCTLVLNVFLLRETKNLIREHEHASMELNRDSRIHSKGETTIRPATITLLSISFFRILTQLPISITYTIQNLDQFNFGGFMPLAEMYNDSQWRSFLRYWGARIIIEALGASYHALSVFIFYGSTKLFRVEIQRYFSTVKRLCFRNVFNKRDYEHCKSGTQISLTLMTTANSEAK